MDVLKADKLPLQLQEIIVYALAFADAAQPLHGEHAGATKAARGGQELPQPASTAGASSAAAAKQQPQTQSGDRSAANAHRSSCPAQQHPQAAECSNAQAEDCLSSREDANQRQNSSQKGNVSVAAISSKDLITHAQGMESLALYVRSAGR